MSTSQCAYQLIMKCELNPCQQQRQQQRQQRGRATSSSADAVDNNGAQNARRGCKAGANL